MLHQSTAERLPVLAAFYERIFAVTGRPRTIADYACGLNPLAFCTLKYDFPEQYTAFDIDEFTVRTLNQAFGQLAAGQRFTASLGDLLLDPPVVADVSLLLKVLPCLELEQKGASKAVLERLKSQFVVVSYPLKSVSGKEKGMLAFYREQFQMAIGSHSWQVTELLFENELVLIIDKRPVQ